MSNPPLTPFEIWYAKANVGLFTSTRNVALMAWHEACAMKDEAARITPQVASGWCDDCHSYTHREGNPCFVAPPVPASEPCQHTRQATTAIGAATNTGWHCRDCGKLISDKLALGQIIATPQPAEQAAIYREDLISNTRLAELIIEAAMEAKLPLPANEIGKLATAVALVIDRMLAAKGEKA